MFELIRRSSLATTRWRNGAGRKADIANGPGWHVGFAWHDEDAPFSDYTGHDRTITLVEGPGFTLEFAAGELVVTRLHKPAAFDGGAAAQCRVSGACMVLNAMTTRESWQHSVRIGPAGEIGRTTSPAGEITIVVVLGGTLALPGSAERAGVFDAMRVQDGVQLDGDGTLAVIRIAPVA